MIVLDAEQKLRESIASNGKRFRIHTGVILTISFLFALIGSVLLKNYGISELWVRYALACLSGYAVFLVLYLLWYQHIRKDLQRELLQPTGRVQKKLYSKYQSSRSEKKSNPVLDFFAELLLNFLVDELAIAIGLIVIVVAIIVVLVVSPYIVLDLLLAEGLLVAATRQTSQFSTEEALWRIALGTIWIFLGLLVTVECWAFLLSWMYPGAESIGQVIVQALKR